MKIGLLHYSCPPTIGGVEQTLYYHATHLVELGHEVQLIVGEGERFHPRVGVTRIPEIFSRHPQVLTAKAGLDQGILNQSYQDLKVHFREELPIAFQTLEVLIVHNALSLHKNLALTQALWELNGAIPYIGWHHDLAWDRQDYHEELYDRAPWHLLKEPWSGVGNVVVSQAQRKRLALLFGIESAHIHVIPPGFDPSVTARWTHLMARLVERLNLKSAHLVLLLPARVTRRKNIELGIEVLAAMRQRSELDIRLIVTGPPGPHNPQNPAYLDSLLQQTRESHLEGLVHFLYQFGEDGPLEIDDKTMANLYSYADVLIFPSKNEGFGIPLLEAGYLRLPIFCSDLAPFHETGREQIYTFGLEEPAMQIADRILDTMMDDARYLLRRRVRQEYMWEDIVANDLIPLLQEVIGNEEC